MRADGRIGDDAVDSARARVVIELGRIKSDQQQFVQPRTTADDRGLRILRPCVHRWPAERQILRLDDGTRMLAFGEDQDVIFRRALVAARLLVIGRSRGFNCRKARGRCQSSKEDRASCLIRSRHRCLDFCPRTPGRRRDSRLHHAIRAGPPDRMKTRDNFCLALPSFKGSRADISSSDHSFGKSHHAHFADQLKHLQSAAMRHRCATSEIRRNPV